MSTEVRADMAATVFQLLVSAGDQVDADAELLVLESMKMEVPVLAERPGTVRRVAVQEGAVVAEGDLLVVLD